MIFPALPQSAQAEEAESKVSLSVAPVISLSLQDTVAVEVTPTQDGTFSSNTAALSISTNNETGYSLYMATSNGENTLTSQNPGTSSVVSAVNGGDSGVTSANFTNNTWGYNLSQDSVSDTTAYKAVPTATGDTAIITTESPTEADNYNLTFGTKVDTSLPSGTYSNDVVVSVVANPEYVPTISAVADMQDVTVETCAASAEGETATLVDTRDGNDYTVAKINGACWMTQNLRLSGGRTLTSADSNVASSWEFPNNSLTLGSSYTEARSLISSNTSYGGYYNYCAASAGTVCSSSSAQNATYDICPKGWRLPTNSEQSGITGYVSAFSPVLSGNYYNGTLSNTGSLGNWWSATAYNSSLQYYLYYDGSRLNTIRNGKSSGYSVRCIRSNPGTVTINFDGNGSTGGSTASQQIAAGNTASLNTNGFTRTGYAFTGWNTAEDGSGTSYADGADYTVTPATGDTTITLYAQWEELPTTMQDITVAQCQKFASDAPLTLTDTRDNNSYTVRYINGACWMTQNLRLSGGRTLTSADSNVTRNWSFPTGSLTSGNTYTEARSTISSDASYGGYYNYCAASAGTVCSQTQANAAQDICPKGWRLPTRAERDGITSYVSAFSSVYSGYYSNGSFSYTGSVGTWWSATAGGSTFQDILDYRSGSLYTGSYSKYLGLSVRCIRSS